ncbi:MAG: PilZ domain-containing protein [Bdellovibrionota bacterium]
MKKDFFLDSNKLGPAGESNGGGGSKSGINRRLKARYAVNIKVEMLTKGLNHFNVERCANVSLGGLFVCTDYLAEEDERVHVRVIFADKEAFFDVKTRVAWTCDGTGSHPKGLGLEFVDLTKEQNVIIQHFLKDYVNVQGD